MLKQFLISFIIPNTKLFIHKSLANKPTYYFSTDDTAGSSSKKYTSTFKLRSKLAQFFKHIHPDQMNQAPTKIKDQNMRSLKNFNEYIDAINQQKSIQGKLLKFYIAQKMNHKSKKFYSFNLELPQIQTQKMNQQKAQRLLDDIVNALNTKFNEAQQGPSGKKVKKSPQNSFKPHQDDSSIKIQTQEQKIQRQQQTIKPFQQYKTHKDKLTMQRLQNQINSKYMQTQKDNLEMKLRKNVSFADTTTSRPMMWARLSMQESGLYKDYQQILNSLIDPKLIFFSQKMTDKQIEQFKKKLLPGSLDPTTLRNNDFVNSVCEQMQSLEPPMCFLVDDHYSGNQIPGFFTVPYNFKPKQLKQKFNQLKGMIQEQQKTYIQYFDYYKQIQKQLRQNNRINVNLKDFQGNSDISEKILMMRRLSRYMINKCDNNGQDNTKQNNKITFYPMTKQQYDIAITHYCKDYQGQISELLKKTVKLVDLDGKSKVFHLINFKDQDMQNIIQLINIRNQNKLKQQQQQIFQQQKYNQTQQKVSLSN